MSEVAGVVVAHGDLAASLVSAAERISGVAGVLRPVSNESCSPDVLQDRIAAVTGDGPCIIFVDLANGSCAFASRSVGARSRDTAVITGANLATLLDFLFHRDMSVSDLARRIVETGRAGTQLFLPGAGRDASRAVQD